MLKIMTSNPTVTMISKLNPNQPNTIAVVPTPLLTDPFPKSCAICAAATDAVCCHSTLTRTKIEAMKIRARATWETGREGKGLMSISEPVWASCSSCQPGKVARSRKVMKARTMATMLQGCVSTFAVWVVGWTDTHIKYGNTTLFLNVFATQIKFRGS